MGFFSWNTADTNDSIPSVHAGQDAPNAGKPVFLLQPNGKAPIEEEAYEGYGRFGNVDAYAWLAKMNIGVDDPVLGIFLEMGSYYVDAITNVHYVCDMHASTAILKKVLNDDSLTVTTFSSYASKLDNGSTPNDLIANGTWEERAVSPTYPLKFSFNPNAQYNALPASTTCRYQGFFYD